MSDQLRILPSEVRSEIWKVTTDELRGRLKSLLKITAETLQELAEVWIELERRGEDLSALRSGLMSYVRLIARGDILAEAVVRYAGHNHIMIKLSAMPLHAQERLLRTGDVEILTHHGILSRKLHLLSPHEAELALSVSGQRSIRSQRALLKKGREEIDREKDCFRAILTPLSAIEYQSVKQAAKAQKTSVGHLVRRAIEAAGHLNP